MESVLVSVGRMCERKIVSRLKCKDWIPSAYYVGPRPEPMHKDLKDAIDRHRRRSGKRSDEIRETISRLQEFIHFMTEASHENQTPISRAD